METAFVKVVFEESTNLFRQYPEIRKLIERFLVKEENRFPANLSKIRDHIYHRYCRNCGEYLYSPCIDRPVHQHKHMFYKKKFVPKLMERIKIHHMIGLVELERWKNVRVLRFPDKYGRALKSTRIPALGLWSIDEWNQQYPQLRILREKNNTRITDIPELLVQDPLFFP